MGKHAGPAFVNRADNQAMAQPFALDGTTLRGFLLRCDEDALQAQLDKFLNDPSGGAVRYTVLAPVALLYFADFAKTFSESPPDDKKGWLPEKECGIWIPAVRDDDGGKKIALFPLYMFVDSGHACISGREVYGFPKEMARLQVDASPFRCSPVVFETFSPETEGGTAELIRVSQETERGLGERLKELGALAFDAVAVLGLDLMHLLKPLFDRIQAGGIPFVFLRQLRSVADPDVAAYQAICEADAPLDNLTEVKLLTGDWTVQIRQADSHPLVEDLGLSSDKIQPALAFEVGMDFQFSTGKEIWRADPEKPHKKQKIAVLGGGLGSMGAVWGITNQPDWRDHYDITVYQMGWRLGGKGASGRNPDHHQRIEEHGLHVFLGFYENVFLAMRKVYAELGRPPSKPLASFETAFEKFSDIGVPVMVNGKWDFYTIPFPEYDELPGIPSEEDPGLPTSMHDLLTRLVDRLLMVASEASQAHDLPDDQGGRELSGILGGLEKLGKALLGAAEGIVQLLAGWAIDLAEDGIEALARALLKLVQDLYPLIRDNGALQVVCTGLELGLAVVVGFLADDLIENGFDSIDDQDFREWLVAQGANRHLTDATLVMAWYDLAFAFEEGDLDKPNFAAGACLRAILRTCLDYRGAVFWKMQAGMGDTVFGPFYQVLKRRGVKFRFFSKVESIEVADAPDDPTQLECTRINIAIQATPNNGPYNYDPLTKVKDLPCWPSVPKYELLEEGAELKRRHVNLESAWSDWDPVGHLPLEKGKHFDTVIWGISLGAVPTLAKAILDRTDHPTGVKWNEMVDHVKVVRTQAMQLWLKPSFEEAGWKEGEVILDGYAEPFNTWADMTHLLPREDWPKSEMPQAIAYFCGPQRDDAPAAPPYGSDHPGFPEEAKNAARENGIDWLMRNAGPLWPKLANRVGLTGFDFTQLVGKTEDGKLLTGDGAYMRSNVDPTEHYVLSLAGSTRYRLYVEDAGLTNLIPVGDWLNTGINSGDAEAATIAGLQASRKLTGQPAVIPGEVDILGKKGD